MSIKRLDLQKKEDECQPNEIKIDRKTVLQSPVNISKKEDKITFINFNVYRKILVKIDIGCLKQNKVSEQ